MTRFSVQQKARIKAKIKFKNIDIFKKLNLFSLFRLNPWNVNTAILQEVLEVIGLPSADELYEGAADENKSTKLTIQELHSPRFHSNH